MFHFKVCVACHLHLRMQNFHPDDCQFDLNFDTPSSFLKLRDVLGALRCSEVGPEW